jgi:uncharacterized SAM-binding protein YcdF (DUF218 family)
MNYPFSCITDFIFVETEIQPADIILVPGGSYPQQIEKVAELYHQGMAPYILPSGGHNVYINEVEWIYMRSIALELGVPEEVILKEDQAKNTFDNAKYSWEVIKSMKIDVKRVIMVCKGQHSRRALLSYQAVFPQEIEFMVTTVMDNRGISKENWFLKEEKIKLVMTEVEKIGRYFGHHIPNWVR